MTDIHTRQQETPLLDAITKFQEQEPAYFRIPAHRFQRGINSRFTEAVGEKVFRYDLSEAEGLDDLHHAQGPIQEAQELAADLWKAKKSFFLVNGTTCGNEAMMLSVVNPGEKVMVMRNMHKSVLMGLIMGGAVPCYINPEYYSSWKLDGSVTPEAVERGFLENPDCRAVFLVSPNYYGIASNLEKIAEICHAHGAILGVDEAHGGHTYFSEMLPKGALQQGVDLCAQSIHKTAGSMTQSSLLHIGSERVDPLRVAANLQLVQSTSPSYILMASLDAARQELAVHGQEMMKKAICLSVEARQKLSRIPGIQVLERPAQAKREIYDLDLTRVVFSARELQITGYRLQELLYERGGVSTELADEENVVCVITFANTEEDISRLVQTLAEIAKSLGESTEDIHEKKEKTREEIRENHEIPPMVLTPREAYFHEKKTICWKDAVDCIAGEMIVPYPPGIPLIYPGERITAEIMREINRFWTNGCVLHGPKDDTLETFQIIE
ncbi:MAG: aminotransferase class I/II-fold pyridoxal phosphate-dependent enzyme [Lachnospiraceae bacterium]|nr:aminotransferase class I/II-fold pyridoxal phosphate-dependent enzyme [Lachnospiraceae bacterium]